MTGGTVDNKHARERPLDALSNMCKDKRFQLKNVSGTVKAEDGIKFNSSLDSAEEPGRVALIHNPIHLFFCRPGGRGGGGG